MPPVPTPDPALWQRALDGDRDAFEEALAPFQDSLLRHARVQVELGEAGGRLQTDEMTAEELAGETLVRAYEGRRRYDPAQMRLGAWLLGLQHRALARYLREEERHASRKAFALTDEVPLGEDQDMVEEAMYEFRQPFDVTTYDELIPGSAPGDVEVPAEGYDALSEEDRALLADASFDETGRQAVLLHDEFSLSLAETAQILEASLKDTAEHLGFARATLRERIGSADLSDDGESTVDSYTGEPD